MTQTYTVTLWTDRTARAVPVVPPMTFPLYATADQLGLVDGLNTILEYANEHDMPLWLSVGSEYKGGHTSKGWQDTNCIVLEWNEPSTRSVVQALHKLNLYAILLQTTEGRAGRHEHITAIIPCDARIDSGKDYSRLASLLVNDIKAVDLIGGEACTFFIHAQRGAEALEMEAANLFCPEDEIGRTDFVKVADFKAVA